MRSLVQITLQKPGSIEEDEKNLENWLLDSGFSPFKVILPNEWKNVLLLREEPSETDKENLTKEENISLVFAIQILFSIPLNYFERQEAINSAVFVIDYYDNKHTSHLHGLVCVDRVTIRTRWKYHISRPLESTTERFVEKIMENAGEGKLFCSFDPEHIIPVREPLSNNDTYFGKVRLTNEQIKEKAVKEKIFEYKVARWGFSTIVFIYIVEVLFSYLGAGSIQSQILLNIISGIMNFLDRISTAAIITTIVSYLGYRIHKSSLKDKAVIEWQ